MLMSILVVIRKFQKLGDTINFISEPLIFYALVWSFDRLTISFYSICMNGVNCHSPVTCTEQRNGWDAPVKKKCYQVVEVHHRG